VVLVTDMGFIVKNNNDLSRDIFVQQISTHSPMSDAAVSVLGRNGRTVFETTTNSQGHAVVPDLSSLEGEKAPVAILVTKDSDFVYLPTNQANRRVNYSRFDTGGQHTDSNHKEALSSYLFTDRGIYRPGETVNIAAIVRDEKIRTVKSFNVEFTIADPLGTIVYHKSHLLPNDGFLDVNFDTSNEFNTGVYTATLSINSTHSNYQHLGSVNFSVEEFQPDRLKINTTIHDDVLTARDDSKQDSNSILGWLTDDELKFSVSLQNLFGTAAQDRKITANYRIDQAPFTYQHRRTLHYKHTATQLFWWYVSTKSANTRV